LINKPREFALFTIGINTNLIASDLLRLKVGQVKDLKAGNTVEIKEQKTGKARRITMNKTCIKAIQDLLASKHCENDDYLVPESATFLSGLPIFDVLFPPDAHPLLRDGRFRALIVPGF